MSGDGAEHRAQRFPLLFNRYFGTTLPLLPDATFWSSDQRPYDFSPVE